MTLEERCAIKIGAWQEGQRCLAPSRSGPFGKGQGFCSEHLWLPNGHAIPCPDMHSAEMVVKMIDWYSERRQGLIVGRVNEPKLNLVGWMVGRCVANNCELQPTLAAALLHAIDALEVK